MPSTAASAGCRRRMISDASDLRSSRGFRLIWRRPLFGVMLVPSTPMNDDRLATSGSFRMMRASACWRSAIVGNETTQPLEWPTAGRDRALEHPLDCPVEPRIGAWLGDAQAPGAHHARERQ